MKVGLLTYHSVCNFGANLQAYSTVSFFKNRGIGIKIINWFPTDLEQYYINTVPECQRKIHADFVKQHLPETKLCRTSSDVAKVITDENFDAIVIGSDAVFSYYPLLKRIHPSRKTLIGIKQVSSDHKFPNPFWADFKKKNDRLKIIALSASAQYLDIDKCLPFEKRNIGNALKRFDLITVRDRWTKAILNNINPTLDIEITPDPVFGFNQNTNIQTSKKDTLTKFSINGKYVILSFCSKLFNNDWFDELYSNLHEHGYTVVNLAMPEGCIDIKSDMKINVPLSPLDWYNIIKFSNGYIGQRMHPMIVALHNSVPITIFDHYAYKKGRNQLQSSKIYDLLERAGLLGAYINVKDIAHNNITPSNVCDRFYSFNKQAASTFLAAYHDKYNTLMTKIISLL